MAANCQTWVLITEPVELCVLPIFCSKFCKNVCSDGVLAAVALWPWDASRELTRFWKLEFRLPMALVLPLPLLPELLLSLLLAEAEPWLLAFNCWSRLSIPAAIWVSPPPWWCPWRWTAGADELPVEVFPVEVLALCCVPLAWPREANKFCRNACNASAGVCVVPEAALEPVEAVEVDGVAADDVPVLPDKLCSRAWTIVFRKLDCPAVAGLPMLELLSPSESAPPNCFAELDGLLVGCNQDQLFEPETLLIELIMNSFTEMGNDMGSLMNPFKFDYR